jgi:hypothetical protein
MELADKSEQQAAHVTELQNQNNLSLTSLRAERDALLKDKARLDYLEQTLKHPDSYLQFGREYFHLSSGEKRAISNFHNLRDTIDALSVTL